MIKLALLFLALLLPLASNVTAAPPDNGWAETYGRVLNTYVTSSGVKYSEWKKNSADVKALAGVTEAIAQESVASLGKNDQLAFYINAYNAWILHGALEKYPTSSVKDLFFRFFTADNIRVAGQQTSFKKLEDNVIRGKFHNPGVHFALNCASRSCPPLSREPFKGDSLDGKLEELARAFINSEKGVKYDESSKTAQLSAIFDWYKNDFPGGALAYINKHREKPLPDGVKITYQKYDWSLNEAK